MMIIYDEKPTFLMLVEEIYNFDFYIFYAFNFLSVCSNAYLWGIRIFHTIIVYPPTFIP